MEPGQPQVVTIEGSYRRGGHLDALVEAALAGVRSAGATVHRIRLAEKHIEFCTNCRRCTQEPGPRRGRCHQEDDLQEILDAVEAAAGLVLAAPVNFFNINALTRRFLERLVCYAEWPWGAHGPKVRRRDRRPPALLITTTGMPGFLTPWATGAPRALGLMASTLGARKRISVYAGFCALKEDGRPPARFLNKARRAGGKLLR